MAKKILKRGKLSAEEIQYIKDNHKKVSASKIADELRRSQEQVDKYIVDNLKEYVEENKEALKKNAPYVDVERVGTATQMTPAASSIEIKRTKRVDPPWIFRQPKSE